MVDQATTRNRPRLCRGGGHPHPRRCESRYTWTDTAYAAASRSRNDPNDLDLAKAYLPHVADAKMIGFMATFPENGVFRLERARALPMPGDD
jgi:hypothetical protein